MAKYRLHEYRDSNKPAIFFGCYAGNASLNKILRHRALGVVVWGGSDSTRLLQNPKRCRMLKAAKNIRHVAISWYISEDLRRAGLPHIHVPICPASVDQFKPHPLGKCIYVYSSHRTPWFYGEPFVHFLSERMKGYSFKVYYSHPPNCVDHSHIIEVYKQCFVGIRLTPHDGLPNTVVELGLMGRKCVYNGELPNAIPWKTVDDVRYAIIKESKRIGTTRASVSNEMRKFLSIDDSWLTTKFYK